LPPPPLSPAGVPLADAGTRILAYLIDLALLSAVTTVIALPVAFVVMFKVIFPAQDDSFSGVVLPMLLLEAGIVLFVLLAYYLYAVEYMLRSGQTIGKRLMKIRVVPLDPSRRLTRWMATKRYLVEWGVGVIVPLFHYLDGLWLVWDKPYQQTLHDKAAGTVVVKVSP
jgi:uncharacterized RDD family membrane protein YckC